jgi:hypothetical protein
MPFSAQYLQSDFCVLAILRNISLLSFGSEPFGTASQNNSEDQQYILVLLFSYYK